MFAAASQYWESVHLQESAATTGAGHGVEIARLVEAENLCDQAAVFGAKTGLDTASTERMKALVIQRKAEAIADNNKIYMDPVPLTSQLPPIKPATLVKPLPLPETMTASPNPPIFKAMLPERARGAVDRYTKTLDERKTAAASSVADASSQVSALSLF